MSNDLCIVVHVMTACCSTGVCCSGDIHFSQSVYTATVNETSAPEYPRPTPGFVTVSCTAMYPPVTYSIDQQTASQLPFEINPTTGELNATDNIDYDSLDSEFYSFNVSCSDVMNTTTALVEVYITPVNEYKPVIDPSLVLTIDETTPSGTLLLSSLPGGHQRLVVEDMDRGTHSELNFTLLTPLDDHFTFDPIHANLTLVRAVDFETESSLSAFLYHDMALKIRVCDAITPSEECCIVHFPLFILASDDNEPMFLKDVYTTAVDETTAIGSTLLVLECSDVDVHIGGVTSIDFLTPPSAVQETFSLWQKMSCNDSVQLILTQELDYDKLNQTYEFQVSCKDLLHNTTANVSISVLPMNDEVPMFTSTHYQFTIIETTPVGTTIGRVLAVDGDIDSGLPVSYTIISPRDSTFNIDPDNGEITVNSSLFDLTVVTMVVSASDGDWETYTNVTVVVYRSDIIPPRFINVTSSIAVSEGAAVGYEVVTLTASDADTSQLSFTIITLTVHGTFILDMMDSQSSSLKLGSALDYENTTVHYIAVEVVELRQAPGEPQQDILNLTIHVLDINDNRPTFTDPYHESISLPDTTSSGPIHSVECTDEDSGTNGEIMYEILPQHNLFAVDPVGNILVTIPLQLPDFKLSETYNISIQCRDKAIPPLSSNKNLTITIIRIDTQPPLVNISNTLLSLPEDIPSGSHVLSIAVYDIDSLAVSVVIVNQTLPGTFAISPSFSPYNHPHYPQLIVNERLDRELIATHYIELLAVALPSTIPTQNISFSLNITVQDINDNTPNCSDATVVITAGYYSHTHLLRLSCTDEDEGMNQQLMYEVGRITPSLPNAHLTFNQTSGELWLGGGIGEGVYHITAMVTDQGTPPLHTDVRIELQVIKEAARNDQGISLAIIILLAVVVMLVVVCVASVCGLCGCYRYRAHADNRRKQYFVRY